MDAPLALYRRYRPETFAEVIGQDHVTEPLCAALTSNRVHHAYLFSGPRGCGKTTSARILARCLNCEKGPTDTPCGQCQSCQDLARGGPGSIDVIEIDAASHGGVDDARDLRERAFFAPVSSRYKVYIIDEAHMVSTQGFNALLKLVEEPPEHLKFVFATTEPDKVIGTIRSRTHHYPFRLIPPRILSDYLSELSRREGVHVEPAALPLVVRAGGGSARDSLSVLDQLIGGAGADGVTYSLATNLLGYTPDTLLDEVVDAFTAGDGATVFAVVDKVIESGQDPRRFTEDLLRRLRDLVIVSAVPGATSSGLVDVPQDQGERLAAQAARFGRADLTRAAELVAAGLTELKGATAPRLLLELLCARVLLPAADDSTSGVMARLDRLEKRMAITGGQPSDPGGSAPSTPVSRSTDRPAGPRDEPSPAPQPQPARAAPPATSPAAQAADQPASEQPATDQPGTAQPGAEQAESAPPETAGSSGPSGLTLVDLRRLWPDVIEATKHRRRLAWILLSQNAQVVAVDDQAVTVGFDSAGARTSFVNGGNDDILRQVLIDVIGHEWRVDAIVDPAAQPGTRHDPTSVTTSTPPTPTGSAAPSTPQHRSAPVEPAESSAQPSTGPRPDREGADRDDPDSDDNGMSQTELLERELGASIIEQIDRD